MIRCPKCDHYFEAVELENLHRALREKDEEMGRINGERLDLLEERRAEDQVLRVRRERPERELPTSTDPTGFPPRGSQRHRVLMALAERGAEGGSAEELMYDTDMGIAQVKACTDALRKGKWIAVREGVKHGTRMGGHAGVLAPTRRGWRALHEREGVSVPAEMFYDPEPETLFDLRGER